MVPDFQVQERDDGLFEIVSGDITKGPFPTRLFASKIASGEPPEPKEAVRFRHFRTLREVRIAP
ncbi:hypothetical protein N2603_23385 [Bradyrhizobium huanghuaihaiense]|uniref:hypothetical protein n=1 Tax=Bradyrhizobium huanghuaihaiense TaxID=990078 RepID=UPI0021AAED3C|nr:hypothetical protein [Bradyrhizobium sp. CB3035]UWU73050.1 hypothetical protein N2603_23385 [Bradyrhizobium sp. CB3035]